MMPKASQSFILMCTHSIQEILFSHHGSLTCPLLAFFFSLNFRWKNIKHDPLKIYDSMSFSTFIVYVYHLYEVLKHLSTPQGNYPLYSHCPFPPSSKPVITRLSVVYQLLCLCVRVFVWTWMCGSVWRLEVDLRWLLIVLHLTFWGQGLSLNLEITSWARLAGQRVPGILVSLSPWDWDYRYPAFWWVRGIQTQVLIACVAATLLIPCRACHLHLTTV